MQFQGSDLEFQGEGSFKSENCQCEESLVGDRFNIKNRTSRFHFWLRKFA